MNINFLGSWLLLSLLPSKLNCFWSRRDGVDLESLSFQSNSTEVGLLVIFLWSWSHHVVELSWALINNAWEPSSLGLPLIEIWNEKHEMSPHFGAPVAVVVVVKRRLKSKNKASIYGVTTRVQLLARNSIHGYGGTRIRIRDTDTGYKDSRYEVTRGSNCTGVRGGTRKRIIYRVHGVQRLLLRGRSRSRV